MLDTNSDPNLVSEANPGNFDQNFNLDEYFPSTIDANSDSMMPTTSGTAQNDLIEISQPDLNTYNFSSPVFIKFSCFLFLLLYFSLLKLLKLF
jgi:hypothetical protein